MEQRPEVGVAGARDGLFGGSQAREGLTARGPSHSVTRGGYRRGEDFEGREPAR